MAKAITTRLVGWEHPSHESISQRELAWMASYAEAFSVDTPRNRAICERAAELANMRAVAREFGVDPVTIREVIWRMRRRVIRQQHFERVKELWPSKRRRRPA